MEKKRAGLTMLELFIGFVIFSTAMLPILMLGTSQARGAHSVGKHMMAGQLAASIMDQLLAMKFRESYDRAVELRDRGRLPIMEEPMLLEVLQAFEASDADAQREIEKDLRTSFRFFSYSVNIEEGRGNEAGQMFKINIQVFWRVDEGNPHEQSLMLSAIKFYEDV